MRRFLLVCLVVGCGSSSKQTNDPARAAADARRKQIDAMQPASPYEVRDRAVYRPSERCGQGPYRIESDGLHAKYGENLTVYACGKHTISGNYRLTKTQRKGLADSSDESAFGWDRDNAACKARDVVATTSTTSGGGGGGGAGGGGKPGATASAPAKIQPVSLARVAGEVPTDCVRTQVIDMTWRSTADGIGFDGRAVLDVWSDEPNDLDGLVFIVERSAVRADMTLEGWKAYLAANDAYYDALRAHLDGEVRAGRVTVFDSTVKTPPPPAPRAETPPPKPSKNARWIPGYWLYAEAKFHWIAGLWDVPQQDIEQQLTVQAPKPPPAAPPRAEPVEPVEPKPTTTAVWTPGSWQWNGTAYIWIEGAWRIPPDAQHTWQRPTWNVSAGRAIYVPGGWRVRVRLGR